jgi:RNA polymerase sigma factor (sigma-70 family)
MTNTAPKAIAITKAVEEVMRRDRGRLLAALTARLRDFQLAEEVLQEAMISALSHWGRSGLPQSPQGWLLKVALRKAIDRIRGSQRSEKQAAQLAILAKDEADDCETDEIKDERLRLIFTCCHPALEPKSQIALTLRSLCGLSTAQVAAVFLDAEPTMGQRLTRAKAKIASAGIPFTVPGSEDWGERLNAVLTVIYLVFTAGYTATPSVGRDLCEEAIFLARMMVHLRPAEPEVEGCLALLCLTHARAKARVDAQGTTVPPARQDQTLWDQPMLAEGRAILDVAMARRNPGPFQIKAAIAACHANADGPDWPQIAALYDGLLRWEPTAPVALSLVVARMETGDLAGADAALATLSAPLADYQPYYAASAELNKRLSRKEAAIAAYDRALALCTSAADAAFLKAARAELI